MFEKLKNNAKRFLAAFLALTMMIPGYVPSLAATDSLEESDPALPAISIEWNDGKYKDGDSTDIVEYNATTNNVKLKVAYSQKEVSEAGYAAGDLVITVKGIGALNRGGTLEAVVGADKSDAAVKTRDWTYTWNKKTDTYTFTNNAAIEPGSVFSGYFELVWQFQSRNDITDYEQTDVQAILYLPSGESVESNILTFSNTTFCDTYYNDIYANDVLLNNDGLDELIGADADDYIWVRYDVARDFGLYRSRGLKSGPYDYFNPDATGVGSGAIVIASISDVTAIVANSDNDAENSGAYKVTIPTKQYLYHDYHREGYIWVAYPRSEYEDQTVTATLNTYGTYNEYDDNKVAGQVLLASSTTEKSLAGITLIEPTGNIYNMHKLPYEMYYYNKSSEVQFQTTHYISSDFNYLGVAMDIEVADDSVYIRQTDGYYRQLSPDEYSLNSIVIPAAYTFETSNGFNVTNVENYLFDFDVYAVRNGETITLTEENLVTSGTVKAYATQTIILPAGTTAVSVVYRNANCSFFNAQVRVNATIDIDDTLPADERGDFADGDVVNCAFIRLYDSADGSWLNKNADFYRVTFTGDYKDEAEAALRQSDIDIYGTTMFRSTAVVYLRKTVTKNRVSSATSISDIVRKNEKYLTDLTLRASFATYEDEYPSKFSIYTIIPDYADIYGCDTVEDLFDTMQLSGFGFDADTLKEHCSLEVVENYEETGATYVALHFDFSNLEVPQSGGITATIPLKIDNVYYEDGDGVILVKSAVDAESISSGNTYYTYKSADDGSWYTEYPTTDIDGDGNTNEILAYSSGTFTWVSARSSQWQQVKRVKTSRTDGDYIITSEEDAREDYPEAEYGTVYSYMLSVTTGNSILKDAVIYDYLEQGEQAEWQGVFKSVDLSYAKKLGIAPTVYYSTNPDASQDLASGDWTTEPADMSVVKAVAIDLRAYEVPASTTLRIVVNMTAPNDASLKNKITENAYYSVGTMVDMATGIETVIDDDLPSNLVQVRLVPGYRRLTITKVDAEDGSKLSGADFSLYVMDGDEIGDLIATGTTNSKGILTVKDLPEDQEYLLVETSAPQGYLVAGDNTITFNNADATITVENERKTGDIKLTKVCDLLSSVKIAGAEYTLYDADGGVVDIQTTDTNGELTFADLVWGDYTVKETNSPAGYQLNETAYSVTINRDNVETVQVINAVDEQNEVSVHLEKYAADTKGNALDIPLSGAVFELLRESSNGNYKSIGTYVTDRNGCIDLSELIYGEYLLREIRAPQGYELCDDIEFALSPDCTDVVLTAYDSRKTGFVGIVKNDDMGNFVKGAEFTLYAEDKATVIATATTDEAGVVNFYDLEWGTYYVKETKAPQGYELDETYHYVNISASNLNVNLTITNRTIRGSVLLTKTDESGMYRLEGAEFALYSSDNDLLYEGLTTDENGEILVEDLAWGSYYFKETKAPVGYGLSNETIRFSVNYRNCEVIQEIDVTDPQDSRVITLTKRIKAEDINFDSGIPTFTFKLEGTDVNGTKHVFYRMVTFTNAYVEDNTDSEGYVYQSVTFSGFLAGEYVASEEESARYYLSEISDYDGVKNGNTILFDMVTNEAGTATFTNTRYEGQNFSDNRAINNVLKDKVKLTGITAEWTADTNVKADTEIDRDSLVVTAFYDDGSYEVLENDAYVLSESVFPNQNGNYTIRVSYSERDVTKSDTFGIEIYGMVLRIVALTAEPAVEYVTPGQAITSDMLIVTAHYNDGSTEILDPGIYHEDAVVIHSNDLPVQRGAEKELTFENASSISVEIATEAYTGSYSRFGYGIKGRSYVYTYASSGDIATYTVDGDYVRVFTQSSSGYSVYSTSNYPVIHATFTLTPHYDFEEVPADYIWDTQAAPNAGSSVSVTVQLNPDFYSEADELALTADAEFTISQIDAHLAHSYDFNKLLLANFVDATGIVFTDIAIPDDVTVYDVSAHFEESVFAWMNGTTVYVSSGVPGRRIVADESVKHMFYGLTRLFTIDLTNLYTTDAITSMESMFSGCASVMEIKGLEKLLTSNISNTSYMFNNCTNLSDISFVKDWDTSGFWQTSSMFQNCTSLTDLSPLANWDTSSISVMQNMFRECTGLTTLAGIDNWDVGNVYGTGYMFKDCSSLTNVDALSNWNIGENLILGKTWVSMGYMFSDCKALASIDGLAYWDMSKMQNTQGMFQNCTSLTNADALADWNVSGVEYMDYMFNGCSSLTNIDGLADWDVSKVTSMYYMFRYCSSLADISGLADWNVSSVTDMDHMFQSCSSLVSLAGLADWDVGNVVDMNYMFASCTGLSSLNGLADWDVGNVTNMRGMFNSCDYALKNVDALAGWNVSNVTQMDCMFYGCSGITNIDSLADWDVSKVTTMADMFFSCYSLTGVDGLADWDVSSVTDASYMFGNGFGLTTIDLSGWDTSSWVTNSTKTVGMFSYCRAVNAAYARTQADADLLNASSSKPTTWEFVSVAPSITLTIDNQCPDIISVELPDRIEGGCTEITVTPADGVLLYSFEMNGEEIIGTTFMAPEESGTVTISNPTYWVIDCPDTFTFVQPDSVEPGVTEIQLISAGGPVTVISFEVNGTLVEGDTFVLPEESGTVTITNVTFVEQVTIESDHNPYLNSQNSVVYGEVTFDGAVSLTVELTYQTESTSYDWIYLYDADGNIVNSKKYGGSTKKTETITVDGNYVKIVFRTDGSVNNYYGFKAVITPNYE